MSPKGLPPPPRLRLQVVSRRRKVRVSVKVIRWAACGLIPRRSKIRDVRAETPARPIFFQGEDEFDLPRKFGAEGKDYELDFTFDEIDRDRSLTAPARPWVTLSTEEVLGGGVVTVMRLNGRPLVWMRYSVVDRQPFCRISSPENASRWRRWFRRLGRWGCCCWGPAEGASPSAGPSGSNRAGAPRPDDAPPPGPTPLTPSDPSGRTGSPGPGREAQADVPWPVHGSLLLATFLAVSCAVYSAVSPPWVIAQAIQLLTVSWPLLQTHWGWVARTAGAALTGSWRRLKGLFF